MSARYFVFWGNCILMLILLFLITKKWKLQAIHVVIRLRPLLCPQHHRCDHVFCPRSHHHPLHHPSTLLLPNEPPVKSMNISRSTLLWSSCLKTRWRVSNEGLGFRVWTQFLLCLIFSDYEHTLRALFAKAEWRAQHQRDPATMMTAQHKLRI